MKNKIKNLIIFPISLGILAFLYFILIEWLPLQPYGYKYVGVLPVLLGLLVCAILIVVSIISLLLCFNRSTRKVSLLIFISSISIIVFSVLGFKLRENVRIWEFKHLSKRSIPLINAINLYKKKENKLPNKLSNLIPNYITKLPNTGMAAYPKYNYSIRKNGDELNGNDWILSVDCPRGVLNWDVFFYLSNQKYPKRAFGGTIVKVENWAYVHE